MGPVLVVDDEALVCLMVSRCLENAGYAAQIATSAQEAIDLIEDGLRPSLVVLDLRMPVMCGNDLLQYLIDSSASRAPRIVLSAFVDDLRQELRSEVVAIREKPLSCAALVELVRETIGQPLAQTE